MFKKSRYPGDPRGNAAFRGPDEGAKKKRDQEIKAAFTRQNSKLVLIIGPCSAHDEEAVCALHSNGSQRSMAGVKDRLVLIPRIYTNKPRTTGIGYKGMAHQPDLQENRTWWRAFSAIRTVHIRAWPSPALSAADEMLYPGNFPYLDDVLMPELCCRGRQVVGTSSTDSTAAVSTFQWASRTRPRATMK